MSLKLRGVIVALAICSACSTRAGRDLGVERDLEVPQDAAVSEAALPDTSVPMTMPTTRPAVDAGEIEGDVVVWAHSASTLYAFEPRELVVRAVGQFTSAGGGQAPPMTDLAVDDQGRIFTCSRTALFEVDPETAVATHIADFDLPPDSEFNGLTFIPAGILASDRESLVGATDHGQFFEVDTTTGRTSLLGTYSNGYISSGDIVSVEGAGTYATVKRDDLDTDILVRIDPTTGQVTRIGDGIGVRRVFGLGYFRSRLYGFIVDGGLIEIDIETGLGEPVDTTTGTDQFWGAGVTTLAPVGPF